MQFVSSSLLFNLFYFQKLGNTLNIVCSVTYYLELRDAMTIYCVSHYFLPTRSDWLFGHYKTLAPLLG